MARPCFAALLLTDLPRAPSRLRWHREKHRSTHPSGMRMGSRQGARPVSQALSGCDLQMQEGRPC